MGSNILEKRLKTAGGGEEGRMAQREEGGGIVNENRRPRGSAHRQHLSEKASPSRIMARAS